MEAAAKGAKLVVFPEMASSGYVWESREEIKPCVETIPGPTTNSLLDVAKKYGSYAVIGLPEVDASTGIYYNSAALIGPEGVIGVYRKTHLYAADPRWAREGSGEIPVFETAIGRVGILICMDAMYFEPARLAALKHADIIAFPTNWVGGGNNPPSKTWCLRAKENGVSWVAANRSDQERGAQFTGGSSIIDAEGNIQSMLVAGEGIVYGEIRNSRDKRQSRLAARRPRAYQELLLQPYLWEEGETRSLTGSGGYQTVIVPYPEATGDLVTIVGLTEAFRVLELQLSADEAMRQLFVLPTLKTDSRLVSHALLFNKLRTIAGRCHGYIVFGLTEKGSAEEESTVYLIGPEGLLGSASPIHHNGEIATSENRRKFQTVELPFARVGLLPEADAHYPESYRVLAKQGADIIAVCSSGEQPDTAWMKRIWAFENDAVIAVAAPSGSPESLLFLHRQIHDEGDLIAGPFVRTLETQMTETVRRRPFMKRLKTHLYERLVIDEGKG